MFRFEDNQNTSIFVCKCIIVMWVVTESYGILRFPPLWGCGLITCVTYSRSASDVLNTVKVARGQSVVSHPGGPLRCPEPGHLWSTEQCQSSWKQHRTGSPSGLVPPKGLPAPGRTSLSSLLLEHKYRNHRKKEQRKVSI